MFRKDTADTGSNFWISYADLMAGLLFVFILLIGAIVSKSIILKSDLHKKEQHLLSTSQTLKEKEERLKNLDAMLLQNRALLKEKEERLKNLERMLAENRATLKEREAALSKNSDQLRLKEDEIAKLNKMLLAANTQKDTLSKKILLIQEGLDETKEDLTQTKKRLKAYEGKVLILSEQLSESNKTLALKDKKLLTLLNALDEKQTKYDELVAKLQSQKAKIKSLTGIKLKVIAALKDALGKKINIDKKTGSLRLASNILFDKGSAKLKDEAKVQLKEAFEEYIGTLVRDPRIKPHIDKIIIEGHTDSDGGYLYNLDLSQKRAFAVMNYLLSLDFSKKYNLKPLLVASGRAYLDAIKHNGVEDKDASRRIEIKFRLKNEDAMHEIEKVLDAE